MNANFRLMARPTLRSLERTLGISRTTISKALRGSPLVNAKTAERIRSAAAAAGYRYNPIAGMIMSEMRRPQGKSHRGVLAILELEEADRPDYSGKFHEALRAGASRRAVELDFRAERFIVGPRNLPQRRVDQILQSRAIRGVLLLPTWGSPDYLKLNWSSYSGVYLDYHIERPPISCVCCDHFRSMMLALGRLIELGYKRPGLVLSALHDQRLQHRWAGAFLAFRQQYLAASPVPPLIAEPITQAGFTRWFRRHRPDVVLAHSEHAMEWMQLSGAKIPATHGFFCLNLLNTTQACAGLDQHPELIGQTATDMVVAQIYRNEFGVPRTYSLTTIPAECVAGPTIRRRNA